MTARTQCRSHEPLQPKRRVRRVGEGHAGSQPDVVVVVVAVVVVGLVAVVVVLLVVVVA